MGDGHVFISYATEDKTRADAVCENLEIAGSPCWIAPRDIGLGKLYSEEIVSALLSCRAVVLLLSSSSNKSRHVVNEIDRAFNRGVPILVLRVEDVEPVGALAYYVSGFQWLDAFSPPLKSHLDRLCEYVGSVPGARALSPVVVEAPIGQFCLPWPAKNRFSTKVRNAAVLLTDVNSLSLTDLSHVAEHCRKKGRVFVLVAPTLEIAAIKLTESVGGLAIEAAELPGQPLNELLEDLGSYLGGGPVLREVGFGLPSRPEHPEKTDKGIYYPTSIHIQDIFVDSLCTASEVWTDSHQTYFETKKSPKLLRARESTIRLLKYRAGSLARSNEEFNGLNERLRRFGAAPVTEHVIERVSFEVSANQVTLPVGFASRYFITDMDRYHARLEAAKILVTTCTLADSDVIVPALECGSEGLVVFASRVDEPALATIITNRLRGTALSLVVQGCSREQLAAVAHLSGASLIGETNFDRKHQSSISKLLGNAHEVIAEIHKTTITR